MNQDIINKLLDLLPEPMPIWSETDYGYEEGYNDCLMEIVGIIQCFDPEREENNET